MPAASRAGAPVSSFPEPSFPESSVASSFQSRRRAPAAQPVIDQPAFGQPVDEPRWDRPDWGGSEWDTVVEAGWSRSDWDAIAEAGWDTSDHGYSSVDDERNLTHPYTSRTATATAPPASRRAPGRRKRAKSRTIPTVPVVAGVATLIAASAGAVALTSQGSGAKSSGLTLGRSMPQTMALGADRLSEARKSAAERSDRSTRRNAAAERAQNAEVAKDRKAWQARHNLELADAEKRAGSVEGKSVLTRNIQWFMPVSNYRMSAGYGQSSSLWSSTHTGQDFAVPIGTPVKAIGNARVVQTGWDGPYGKQVRLVHEDGTETWYCHLSRWSVGDGERVRAGEVIGYSGSTGNSTGPHLHLEVRPGGDDPIDPVPWLRDRGLL